MKLKNHAPRLQRADERLKDGGSWRAGLSTSARGYDHDWKLYRLDYLKAHPLCVRCCRRLGLDPLDVAAAVLALPHDAIPWATVVDHIIPHEGDKVKFWNPNNHEATCKPCHDGEKQKEENAQRYGR
jgi:5-methylcytosine-specific restriction enzyme A